jgi:hypothetical protein
MKIIYLLLSTLLLSCAPVYIPEIEEVLEEVEEPVVEQEERQDEEPEEEAVLEVVPEPDYLVMYSLTGYYRTETIPWLEDYESYPFVIDGVVKTIQIGVEVDKADYFLFMAGVSQNFFGFELDYMTRQELDWMAEVLQRYPEVSIWDLQEEYQG